MPPELSQDAISFSAHPWAVVAYITNYSTLLLLALLFTSLGIAPAPQQKGRSPLTRRTPAPTQRYLRRHCRLALVLLPPTRQQEALREFDEVPEYLQDLLLSLLLMRDGALPLPHHRHPAQMPSLLVAHLPVLHF